MGGVEFYLFGSELWYKYGEKNERFTESCTSLIQYMIDIIGERYPEAYAALSKEYQKSSVNVQYYQYLIVRRFCKCNFGTLDTTRMDACDGRFNFEKVSCPLRGECRWEGVVCQPKINTHLSSQELRVMRMVYVGCDKEKIAERLFISPNTVKNHIKSVYAKLGLHDRSAFIRYAEMNGLFPSQEQ